MKRYIGTLAALALAGFMLTGCGDKTVEEGVSLLEEQDYKGAAELFEQAVERMRKTQRHREGLALPSGKLRITKERCQPLKVRWKTEETRPQRFII